VKVGNFAKNGVLAAKSLGPAKKGYLIFTKIGVAAVI
jgi:hypothetical protein